MNRKNTEALLSLMAAAAIGMIRNDPELTGRFKTELAGQECPVPADVITPEMLEAMDLALTLRAGNEMQEDRSELFSVSFPIPQIEDGAAKSSTALGLGGFLAEYMGKHSDAAHQFQNWLNGTYPGAANRPVSQDEYEGTDQLLTLMSGVARKLADSKEGDLDLSEAQEQAAHP